MLQARHRAREIALQVLYRFDLAQETVTTPQAFIKDLQKHFDYFEAPHSAREFAAQLVTGVLLNRAEVDGWIETSGSHWKIARMGLIDRNILRISVFELKNFNDIDTSIIIDEAVELGKEFGSNDTAGFVNGVLDGLKSTLRNTA